MNDHRDHRRRTSEPAWPTGDDPDLVRPAKQEQPQERTGFWSPLWDDLESEEAEVGSATARSTARRGTNGNGARADRSNGRAQPPRRGHNGNTHRATEPPVPPGPHRAAARGPAWPPVGPRRAGAMPSGAATVAGLAPSPRPSRVARTGQPAELSEQPTEVLTPVGGRQSREPELLTHREPDYDSDVELDSDLDEDRPLTDAERKKRRKKVWRRIRRTMYAFIALMIIGPMVAFFIAYQVVEVPTPSEIAANQGQVVTLTFSDGTSELTKIVPEDGTRTMVAYQDIPEHVLNAVYSAEDKDFRSNAGFDITGVMRAGWNQLTGDEGGGSTITQQYIKMATGDNQDTVTRKALEVVKAYKMNKTYSKEDIITAYLNITYFGRNAYGIVAAAKAYYGKELKDVTASEAALLAGMIQSPSRFKDTEYMTRRWNFVMDQLVANNWLPADQRKAEQFPQLIPLEQSRPQAATGPLAHVQREVQAELEAKLGMDMSEIQRRGFTVVTTIDKTAQQLAEEAVREVMKGEPPELKPGLVAVDPNTGRIVAYYGGEEGIGTDWADAPQQPGSTFKPFDLVALLQTGKGLGETYDSTPRNISGITVGNASRTNCGKECPVAQAMKESLNTVFYEMVVKLGPPKVAEAARQAGILSPLDKAKNDAAISIGGNETKVSTTDMASAFATFAANGTYRTPHLVDKVLYPDGSIAYQAPNDEKPAFDSDAGKSARIARNVTESLLPVPEYSKLRCADNRLCAGKSGTNGLGETSHNDKAWFVGYTPQISSAVSLAKAGGGPIINARNKDIYGSGLPGQIWKKFMDSYHKTFNLPKTKFGKYEPIGKDAPGTGSSSSKKPTTTPRSTTSARPTGPTETTTPPRQTRPTRPTPPQPPITLPSGLGEQGG